MKLIIQIPCYNEASWLPITVAALPTAISGFDVIETLVVDDGSTDGTAQVAKELGVDHIVRINSHAGLANAFVHGLRAAVGCGADVIVNTDADNQYDSSCIEDLVTPILRNCADVVVGTRPLMSNKHFSASKRVLQVIGSYAVRALSRAEVCDATSGFRAFTAGAASQINVFTKFTYTLETIIQAGLNDLRVASVPIRVNPPVRPSRLFKSNFGYIWRSLLTMLCVFLIYRPHKVFTTLAFSVWIVAAVLGSRYLWYVADGNGAGHVQSVIACAGLFTSGIFLLVGATITYLQTINRRLLEELSQAVRSSRKHGVDLQVGHVGVKSPALLEEFAFLRKPR